MAASRRLYTLLAESIGIALGVQKGNARNCVEAQDLSSPEYWRAVGGEAAINALVSSICEDLKRDNLSFNAERFWKAIDAQARRISAVDGAK